MRMLILCLALLAPSVALAQPDAERDTANAISRSLVAKIDRDTATALSLPGVGDVVRVARRALLAALGETARDATQLKLAANLLELGNSTYWQVAQVAVLPADVSARVWARVARTLDSAATYAESKQNLGVAAALAAAERVALGLAEVSTLAARSGRKVADVAKEIGAGAGDLSRHILTYFD